jgi:hypothetical protein
MNTKTYDSDIEDQAWNIKVTSRFIIVFLFKNRSLIPPASLNNPI